MTFRIKYLMLINQKQNVLKRQRMFFENHTHPKTQKPLLFTNEVQYPFILQYEKES